MLPRVAVIAMIFTAACHHRATPPGGDVGADLALTTLAGDTFDATTLRGKPALVTFWRPGCEFCAAALPKDLEAAHKAGAAAVAIMVSGDGAKGHDELAKLGWDGPMLADSTLVAKYGIDGVPYTLVLRGNGTAAQAFVGDDASVDDLAAALSAAAK